MFELFTLRLQILVSEPKHLERCSLFTDTTVTHACFQNKEFQSQRHTTRLQWEMH